MLLKIITLLGRDQLRQASEGHPPAMAKPSMAFSQFKLLVKFASLFVSGLDKAQKEITGLKDKALIKQEDGKQWEIHFGFALSLMNQEANYPESAPLLRTQAGAIAHNVEWLLLSLCLAVELSDAVDAELKAGVRTAIEKQGLLKDYGALALNHRAALGLEDKAVAQASAPASA